MNGDEMLLKLADHQKRIEALEEADEKHIAFRREYYQDRESRIRREALLDAKLDNIQKDLAKVLAWQETLVNKPAKRWEGLVEKGIWAVCAAVITFILSKVGL